MFNFLSRKKEDEPAKTALKPKTKKDTTKSAKADKITKGGADKPKKAGTYDPEMQAQGQENKSSSWYSKFFGRTDQKSSAAQESEVQKAEVKEVKASEEPRSDDPLLQDPGHENTGAGSEDPGLPANIVAEKDPLLGKVDAYIDELRAKPKKLTAEDVALLVLTWFVFIIMTTAYFAMALAMIVRFYMSRPFMTFSVIMTLIFVAFLGVVFSQRQRWVQHMFLLCPLAAALGTIVGIGVLCDNGALLHFYEDGRTYTNVLASAAAESFTDAGIFLFESGETAVDTTRHVSFLDHWSGTKYCVAPVIDDKMSNTDAINFWVVGQDCCDMKSFHCHELDGYSRFKRDMKKTALVVPHAAEITPISWLTWLVRGAGQHDKYHMAMKVAHARMGAEPAPGALLLKWTLNAPASVSALSERVWENELHIILIFAILAALFAFSFVRRDAVRQGFKWPKFNPRKALNRRSYHHGLADEI